MRISDWSSDVCSSDLRGDFINAPEFTEAARIPDPRRMIRGHARSAMTMNFVRRSEEHTSELQSLMRISYAVFCLKKKNTNNKTIHITVIITGNTYNV